jgi:hypothetical protein
MCGRYYRTANKQASAEWFHASAASDDPMPPGYNIAPSTIQPVIRQGGTRAPANWSGCFWAWSASARRAQIPSGPPSIPALTIWRGAAFGVLLSTNAAAWCRFRAFGECYTFPRSTALNFPSPKTLRSRPSISCMDVPAMPCKSPYIPTVAITTRSI